MTLNNGEIVRAQTCSEPFFRRTIQSKRNTVGHDGLLVGQCCQPASVTQRKYETSADTMVYEEFDANRATKVAVFLDVRK